jgi:predicted nucleic acid-binding protein
VAEVKSPTVVVCDAGPLIHLDELGCLDLLADFREVLVCEAVWNEVALHRPEAIRRRSVPLKRISVTAEVPAEVTEFVQMYSLAAGEVESILLMANLPEAILLTDDAAARLVAEKFGYEVHGTIGVLVRSLRRAQRTKRQVLNLLRSIPKRSTLHLAEALLNAVIDDVRESG